MSAPKKPKKPKVKPPGPFKKLKKQAGKLKTLVVVLVLGGIGAAISTGVVMVFGAIDVVPAAPLPSIGMTLGPAAVVFASLFSVFSVVGVIYAFFQQQIAGSVTQTVEAFAQLPPVGKGIALGIPIAVGGALTVVLVNIYAWENSPMTSVHLLAIAAVVWIGGAFFAFQHVRAERELLEGGKILAIAGSVTIVFVILISFVDWYLVRAQQLPGYLYLLILAVVMPVATLLVAQEYYRPEGWILSAISRQTGFAQQRQFQGITIAVAIGFVVALMLATMVNLIVAGLLIPLVSFLVFWVAAAAGTYYWFQQRTHASLDLVIVEVRTRSTEGRKRELVIRNESDEPVDLRNAKLRDTEGDMFQTSLDVVLAAGQTGTFNIPPAFALATSDQNVQVGGWSISRDHPAPVAVTRDGTRYELWFEEEKRERELELAKKRKREDEDLGDAFERVSGIDKIEKKAGVDIDLEEGEIKRDKSKKKD